MNTKRSGIVHFLIFKGKKDPLYTGVVLELDLVEQGEDPEKLRSSLEEAARGHVWTVLSRDFDERLLNRQAPSSYWKRAERVLEEHAKLMKERQRHTPHHEEFLELYTRKIKEGSRELVSA